MKNQYSLKERNRINSESLQHTIHRVWGVILNHYVLRKENVTYTQEKRQSVETNPR